MYERCVKLSRNENGYVAPTGHFFSPNEASNTCNVLYIKLSC